LPLYESNAEVVKSEFATFLEVFPDGTIWSNDVNGKGYDVVILGQTAPMKINVDELQQRLSRKNYQSVALSLDDVGIKSGVDLLASYAGRGADLRPWLKDAPINRDRNLRLQYLAGLSLNSDQSERIYQDLMQYRTFPDDLFVASDQRMRALRKALRLLPSRP